MENRVYFIAREDFCEMEQVQDDRAEEEQHTAPVPHVEAERKVTLEKVLAIFCVLLLAALISLSVYHFITLNHKEQDLEELRKFSNVKDFYCDVTNTTHENTCPVCKPGWVPFRSKCYFFSSSELNWTESRDKCIRRGGRLVNIESLEEQKFLSNLYEVIESEVMFYWIGGDDISKENTTTRMDVEPVQSQRASDDYKGLCLLIQQRDNIVTRSSCGVPYSWICESPAFLLRT
ncbi:killer cell lectin-like receptor subfamily G member 1 isoform X1 [Erpetoichthys calabaricus]|uniref:killer cell lectin-like receptor subfamily G member 1 isoform X1 n=1 Tax=Erpetoichthys calabaricus TaxID=27687 RepID=UPI0022347415|nr:killer cell lectin-like receptor subfamily G member 1 isoform X1 [Erpetoichthys calabaricus]